MIEHRMPRRAVLLSQAVNSCYVQVLEVLVLLVTDIEVFYSDFDAYIWEFIYISSIIVWLRST